MKIGVILPKMYRGGVLNGLINIARMIKVAGREDGIELVIGVPAGAYRIPSVFGVLLDMGISVREMTWEIATRQEVGNAMHYIRMHRELPYERYWLPNDGITDFFDCDYWFLITDRTEYPLAPIRPYGVLAYDYIQRYVPSIFEDFPRGFDDPFIATARTADTLFATQPATAHDAIQYCGISREKTCLLPLEFNPLTLDPGEPPWQRPYLLWTTNTNQHKNHRIILDGIERYYTTYKGQLDVVVSGTWTQWFSPQADTENVPEEERIVSRHPYVTEIRRIIGRSQALRRHLHFPGLMSLGDYASTLVHARFLLHGALYDNGTYSVLEAAYCGVPSLSSDYPQMRYLDRTMHVNMMFFDSENPRDVAEKLKAMETSAQERRQTLPDRAFFEQFSWNNLAGRFWATLRPRIEHSIAAARKERA